MRFNKVVAAVATLFALTVGHAQTNTLSDYLKSTGLKTQALEPPSAEETPQWLKDSKRLNELLGSDAKTRIENAKVVHKVPKAFAGLDAFVVRAPNTAMTSQMASRSFTSSTRTRPRSTYSSVWPST